MHKSISQQNVVLGILFATLIFFGITMHARAAIDEPNVADATFSNPTIINHPYFSLPVGKEMEFEGESDEGLEVIEISISGDTKVVMGITTLVYRDLVYVDGELVEDTRDYLAQDDDGNVWYFGEDVDNYEDGELADHDGAWIAGVDGAEPGYWMPSEDKLEVGYAYREEWYQGEAEDEAEIVATNAKVKIGLGTYNGCITTLNTTPLEPDVEEYKYYCKLAGGLVLEEKPEDDERIELVEVEFDEFDDDDDEDEANDDEDDDDDDEMGREGNRGQIRAMQVRLIQLLEQLLRLLTQ